MNPAEYTSVGVSAAVLAPVITWLCTWPIQPPNDAQAGGMAALIIAAIGGIHSIVQSYRQRPASRVPP